MGWSHGKEKLQDGKPDVDKGSFYANPVRDVITRDQDLVEGNPAYYRPNVWPNDHVPGLEQAFKALGRLIVDIGLLLVDLCEKYE